MRELLYLTLIVINLPLLYGIIKRKGFFRYPLYTSYFYSFYILNILGSCVVFFPSLNIYGSGDLYTSDFFLILLIQSCFFYLFYPLFSQLKYSKKTVSAFVSIHEYISTKSIFYLVFFSVLIIFIFQIQYGLPPLYTSNIYGGNSVLMLSRTNFFENTSQMWFYRIGFYILPQLAGIAAYLIYKRNSNFKNLVIFITISLVTSILALSFLHKTPLSLYWMSILLAKIIYEGKASIYLLVKWIVGILFLVVLWYLVYFPGQDISYYFDFMARSILNRIFGAYAISLAYIPLIVEEGSFFYGKTMINPFGLFPYEIVNLSQMVHLRLFGITGYAPPPAMGYAYADFGYFGVLVTSMFIGVYLYVAQLLLFYIRNNILNIAVTTYLCSKMVFLSMSSASEVLLNPGEVITLCIILMIVYLSSLKAYKC